MPARRTSSSRLHRSAPRWTLFIPVAIAAVLVLLAGMIVSFNQRVSALHNDRGLPEQILGVLASKSARVVALTGRPGASVRLVYDPSRNRGMLVVVRLADPGDNLTYRLWLVQRGIPRTVAAFLPAADRATFVPVRADFARYDAVAVAVGARSGPSVSAKPVLQATLASSETRVRPVRRHPPLRME